MATFHIYLNFEGTTEEAFTLYQSVFGGEFALVQRYKDMPEEVCGPMAAEDKEKIMHMALRVGQTVLMGTDAIEGMGAKLAVGNNVSISLDCESEAEVDRLYHALVEGGTPTMKPEKTFWGAYYAMLTDKFGVQWMFNFDYNKG